MRSAAGEIKAAKVNIALAGFVRDLGAAFSHDHVHDVHVRFMGLFQSSVRKYFRVRFNFVASLSISARVAIFACTLRISIRKMFVPRMAGAGLH